MNERDKPKRKRSGKRDNFSRIARLEITYPPSETGGTIEIVKDRQGKHRTIAPSDVKLAVTYREKDADAS